MLALWISLAGIGATADPVVLERGMLVGGTRYVAVEDTTLDIGRPDDPLGGSSILESGGGKVILIQFRELAAALGRKRIRSARIEFTIVRGEPKLTSARRILVPWTEGPINTIASQIRGDTTGGRWAATQRNRRSGSEAIPWQSLGARGELDAEALPAANGVREGDRYILSGLAEAIQVQLDRPGLNHGFRLEFDERVEFLSSESSEARPRLVLELEDAPRREGADLSVILISRTPEYPRYDTREPGETVEQDGVAVAVKLSAGDPNEKRWPDDGEEVTYQATVKNVGTVPAEPFEAQWFIRELPGELVSFDKKLAPGETATFNLATPFRSSHTDHRIQPIALRLFPKGEERDRANDELEVQQAALALGLTITPEAVAKFAEAGLPWEDAMQRAVHRWNEVLSRYSRYSFAPAGALERVRIQRMAVGAAAATDVNLDAEILVTPDTNLDVEIAKACGLVALNPPGLAAGSVAGDGQAFPPSIDRFAGVLGSGETRSDALLAPTFAFPHERFHDLYADPEKLDIGAGLSATDVYALNKNLGRRRGFTGDYLYDVPGSVLLTVTDPSGKRLPNQELAVYAMRGGSFSGANVFERIRTGESGSVLLPRRNPGTPPGAYTPTGHQLLPNPFGRIDVTGANGALAFRTTVHGVEGVAILKIWQVLDAAARARQPLALVTVMVHVPAVPLGEPLTLASVTRDGAAAPVLTDGDAATGVDLAAAPVVIDLGREVALGEITVTVGGEARGGFDLMVHQPGEDPATARLFAREADLSWSRQSRGKPVAGGAHAMSYYGMPMRARFVRLVPRAGSSGIRLLEIKCTPGR